MDLKTMADKDDAVPDRVATAHLILLLGTAKRFPFSM